MDFISTIKTRFFVACCQPLCRQIYRRIIKIPGIAVRRKDTPSFIKDFQEELLMLLKAAENKEQVANSYPQAQKIYLRYLEILKEGKVPWKSLLVRRTVSHALEDYSVQNGTSVSLAQLTSENMPVSPGEKVRYLVINTSHTVPEKRFLAEEKAVATGRDFLRYDFAFYARMVHDAISELYQPFLSEKIPDHITIQNPGLFDILV